MKGEKYSTLDNNYKLFKFWTQQEAEQKKKQNAATVAHKLTAKCNYCTETGQPKKFAVL